MTRRELFQVVGGALMGIRLRAVGGPHLAPLAGLTRATFPFWRAQSPSNHATSIALAEALSKVYNDCMVKGHYEDLML